MMALVMTAPPRPRFDELDAATLEKAARGEPLAQRAFVVRHERAVFALLSRLVGRGPHVEDLAQDTFLKALRALPGFDPKGTAKLSTWLLTIATRTALDARKRAVLPTAPLEEARQLAHGPTPESEAARRQLGARLEKAAAALSDDMRAALLLADVHDFTSAEIAQALGIPENTAKTRVHRARQQMRERLGAERDEDRDEPR